MKPSKPAVVCSNSSCSTRQTSSKTFRIYEGLKYCNACALYLHKSKYNQQRPDSLIMKAEGGVAARCQKQNASPQVTALNLSNPVLARNAKNANEHSQVLGLTSMPVPVLGTSCQAFMPQCKIWLLSVQSQILYKTMLCLLWRHIAAERACNQHMARQVEIQI